MHQGNISIVSWLGDVAPLFDRCLDVSDSVRRLKQNCNCWKYFHPFSIGTGWSSKSQGPIQLVCIKQRNSGVAIPKSGGPNNFTSLMDWTVRQVPGISRHHNDAWPPQCMHRSNFRNGANHARSSEVSPAKTDPLIWFVVKGQSKEIMADFDLELVHRSWCYTSYGRCTCVTLGSF